MRIAVTGSIDQLPTDQLAHVSISFLVDDLQVRRSGAAADIAFRLGRFGLPPLMVGAVGADAAEYEVRPKEHGADTPGGWCSAERQTARFTCLTEQDDNQIAAFHAGATTDTPDTDLRTRCTSTEQPGLVVTLPNDPASMLRHTSECRTLGIPFVAAPSQQLARLDGHQVRDLVAGARWLFTNEYEAALLKERTGWSHREVLAAVGTWVTTLGESEVSIERAGQPVPARPDAHTADPTGVGDAFSAGLLVGVSRQMPLESAASLGSSLAALTLGAVDSQTHAADPARLSAIVQRVNRPGSAEPLTPVLGKPA